MVYWSILGVILSVYTKLQFMLTTTEPLMLLVWSGLDCITAAGAAKALGLLTAVFWICISQWCCLCYASNCAQHAHISSLGVENRCELSLNNSLDDKMFLGFFCKSVFFCVGSLRDEQLQWFCSLCSLWNEGGEREWRGGVTHLPPTQCKFSTSVHFV